MGKLSILISSLLQGWDKTYCLQFVENDYDTIHFFGDKTYKVCWLWPGRATDTSASLMGP